MTQDEEKQNKKHNTICVGHHYLQASTNNVNKKAYLTYRVLENTTGEIRTGKLKYGQHNGHNNRDKREHNDLQNTTQNTNQPH